MKVFTWIDAADGVFAIVPPTQGVTFTSFYSKIDITQKYRKKEKKRTEKRKKVKIAYFYFRLTLIRIHI